MSKEENEKSANKKKEDWTVDHLIGRSNASPRFVELVGEVARLIRNSAHDLIGGNTESVARLIMAQLAHRQGLVPREAKMNSVIVIACPKCHVQCFDIKIIQKLDGNSWTDDTCWKCGEQLPMVRLE